jgi:DtxR family transcriptional regulator, Mn-dependent transcriptional regulator
MKKDVHAVWKEYDENEITHSATHYLFAIKDLLETNGYARMTDISRKLEITAGSCSIGIKSLLRKWLIVEDENKFVKFTPKWEKIIDHILHTRKVLIKFFTKNLGAEEHEATVNACKVEHLLSEELIAKLEKYLK